MFSKQACMGGVRSSLRGSFRQPLLRFVGAMLLGASTAASAQQISPTSIFDQFSVAAPAATIEGQTVTLLSDGRWLLAGGSLAGQPSGQLAIEQIVDGKPVVTMLPLALAIPRVGHTASVLPDGRVLVFGGKGIGNALVAASEIIDPRTWTSRLVDDIGIQPRVRHTATVLTSGLLLVSGGQAEDGKPVSEAELWNPRTGRPEVFVAPLQTPRSEHHAALMGTGQGLIWGGRDASGNLLQGGEVFDPGQVAFNKLEWWDQSGLPVEATGAYPRLAESIPAASDTSVAVDTPISVRFSKPMLAQTLTGGTVTLVGPAGAVPGRATAAEGGMLLFFTPAADLLPGTTYTLFINGASDLAGHLLPFSSFNFTTQRIQSSASSQSGAASSAGAGSFNAKNPLTGVLGAVGGVLASAAGKQSAGKDKDKKDAATEDDLEDWLPKAENRKGRWKVLGLAGDPPLDGAARTLSKLTAAAGVTAVTGRVVRLNGKPLAGVPVSVAGVSGITDLNGGFLLLGVPEGRHQMKVDGTLIWSRGRHYTKHFIQVDVSKGKTSTLAGPVFLARVDPASEISISSPADRDIVLTHPAIPGLELTIPKGAVLRDYEGKIVTKVSITPLPVDRAPYATPQDFSVYFTLQPGGAFVDGDPSKAIKIVYPNYENLPAASPVNFWNYDPNGGGWKIYGTGKVSDDGKKVIPREGLGFRQIMTFGYAINRGNKPPPAEGPVPCSCPDPKAADPVDTGTGLFLHQVTDFNIPDVIPIMVGRTYRQRDDQVREFGLGNSLSYAMYLYTDEPAVPPGNTQYRPTQFDLIKSDGSRVRFTLQSGTTLDNSVWKAASTPDGFYGATIKRDLSTQDFVATLRNGMKLVFSEHNPNQLKKIIDRNGNELTLTLSLGYFGDVQRITSPNGRYVAFEYSTNKITKATDNMGRSYNYTYNGTKLETVTDPEGNVERYEYDAQDRMTKVFDKRGNRMAFNEYDSNSRVVKQTLADNAVWQFAYTLDGLQKVTQTDVTDPRGYVRRLSFDAKGYPTQDIHALGTPEQQTTSYERGTDNLLSTITDQLGRVTKLTYDTVGQLKTRTRLFGTPDAVTTTYGYQTAFNLLTSIKDPLNHTGTFGYDAEGNLQRVTDALNHSTFFDSNVQGLPTKITDALGHFTQIGYVQADVASVTDALQRVSRTSTDGVGRPTGFTDPLGNNTRVYLDLMDRTLQVVDPAGGVTRMSYDGNGNLLSLQDPKNPSTHRFAYDARNRVETSYDLLGVAERYEYDGLGNLKKRTDRKGQVTSYTYDPLNRPKTVTFQDGSTITYTWDAGNRAVTMVDSLNGSITWDYDLLDRLEQETTTLGGSTKQVSYEYDDAGRRTLMQIGGASPVTYTYTYFNNNNLQTITRGSSVVTLGYDNANRRTSVTLPNGVVGTYGYDNANQLTSINYTKAGVSIGAITYGYDVAGRRTVRNSSLDETGLPAAIGSAADNKDYQWNVRDQLTGLSGSVTASFSYDGSGRRSGKTVSGSATAMLYDGFNLIRETGGGGDADYLIGLDIDEAFTRLQGGSQQAYLSDALGSTAALTDESGQKTTGYKYDAYGNTEATGAASANSIAYAGRENDGTGLHYNRARYYSPQFARFISSDPIGLAGGINAYAYVEGNPISYIDPWGLLGHGRGNNGYSGVRPADSTGTLGISGCLFVGCVSYSSIDDGAKAELTPTPQIGLSISACVVPKPQPGCKDKINVSTAAGISKYLGIGFGSDGGMCFSVGKSFDLSPVTMAVDLDMPHPHARGRSGMGR